MKIKKVVHHGKIRWRVNDPNGANGKRQRKFFETKESAERFTHQKIADRDAYGRHFVTITVAQTEKLLSAWRSVALQNGARQISIKFSDEKKKSPIRNREHAYFDRVRLLGESWRKPECSLAT